MTNADLPFSAAATGILANVRDVDVDTAREQLGRAAARAGVPIGKLAQLVIEVYNSER